MANWISSKLKVAETFFEQIDQQAAESLGKNERPLSDEQKFDVPTKTGGTVSLKDQLKKKTHETINNVEYQGKLHTDLKNNDVTNDVFNNINSSNVSNGDMEISVSSKPKPALTDNDWTELLSTPSQPTTSSNRNNGLSAIRGLRKDGRRQGSSGSNVAVQDRKKNLKISNGSNELKSKKRLDIGLGLNATPNDGEESSTSTRSSGVELLSDGKILDRETLDHNVMGVNLVGKHKNMITEEDDQHFESKDIAKEDLPQMENKNRPLEMLSVSEKFDGIYGVKKGVGDAYDRLRSTVERKHGSDAASRSSFSDEFRKGSASSDEGSDSDSDSGSTSDSEGERERERKKKILAEKVAAKAVETIKERENMVARLEGEKQSLDKILEERARQAAQEASELQTTMMETMDAVELEKQKHNNTRMEALARLAKLETANADLAKSLAASQKNLEVHINQVAELRQQFDLKEVALAELSRRISMTHQTGTYLRQLKASKGVGFEQEILEAEYFFLTDKIGRLEDKAKKLEANIEMTRKEREDPTEVEIELKRRLGQLTDHLIQKQAQVEALSSEKGTLLFRIEAVSRLLDENKSMNSKDVESGTWEMADSKFRPLLEDKIRSGRRHLGSLLQQLDAIFIAGAVFLRRNPTAKLWSLVYLACLHFWVIYILTSHSHASNEGKPGAIISLETINNTSGA